MKTTTSRAIFLEKEVDMLKEGDDGSDLLLWWCIDEHMDGHMHMDGDNEWTKRKCDSADDFKKGL